MRREEAENLYETQRAQVAKAAADFEKTLAERRDDAMRELNADVEKRQAELSRVIEQLEAAHIEAQRVADEAKRSAEETLANADRKANDLLSEAKRRAENIRQNSERELAAAAARRDSITAQLANVRQMLSTLGAGSQASTPLTAEQWAHSEETIAQAAERELETEEASEKDS